MKWNKSSECNVNDAYEIGYFLGILKTGRVVVFYFWNDSHDFNESVFEALPKNEFGYEDIFYWSAVNCSSITFDDEMKKEIELLKKANFEQQLINQFGSFGIDPDGSYFVNSHAKPDSIVNE